MIELLHIDCMDFMKDCKDNQFDLAIVDVPYGLNITKQSLGEGGGTYRKPKKYKRGEWDSAAPNKQYWEELFRTSKNQIIWGANHFISKIPFDSSGWIFWDKNNGGSDFADGELAWSSFDIPLRKYKYTWSGYIQGRMGNNKETRIHPTQKPVYLYRWSLKKYAKKGDTILDTHGGSMSLAIACDIEGFDLTLCEIDKDYYDDGVKRFNIHKAQKTLF